MHDDATGLHDALVKAAIAGEATARERLMTLVRPMVRAMVFARLSPMPHQQHDADDLVQESCLGLSQGLDSLKLPTFAALRSFASTIVSRRVADFLKKQARVEQHGRFSAADDDSGAHAIWVNLLADSLTPGTQAQNREDVIRIANALIGLKPRYREVITLALVDQLPIAEIAERLELSRPAASMLFLRALRTLRRDVTGSSKGPKDARSDIHRKRSAGDAG